MLQTIRLRSIVRLHKMSKKYYRIDEHNLNEKVHPNSVSYRYSRFLFFQNNHDNSDDGDYSTWTKLDYNKINTRNNSSNNHLRKKFEAKVAIIVHAYLRVESEWKAIKLDQYTGSHDILLVTTNIWEYFIKPSYPYTNWSTSR